MAGASFRATRWPIDIRCARPPSKRFFQTQETGEPPIQRARLWSIDSKRRAGHPARFDGEMQAECTAGVALDDFFFFFFLLDFRSLAARELLVQKGREESRALPQSSSSESLNIYFILFAPFVATTCIVTIYIKLCRVFHDQSQLNTRRSVFFQLLFTFREAKIYFPAKELS